MQPFSGEDTGYPGMDGMWLKVRWMRLCRLLQIHVSSLRKLQVGCFLACCLFELEKGGTTVLERGNRTTEPEKDFNVDYFFWVPNGEVVSSTGTGLVGMALFLTSRAPKPHCPPKTWTGQLRSSFPGTWEWTGMVDLT